jgi:hypothetical protein
MANEIYERKYFKGKGRRKGRKEEGHGVRW